MNLIRARSYIILAACLTLTLILIFGSTAKAEDGYRLWLRYDRLPDRVVVLYSRRVAYLVVSGRSATFDAIRTELIKGCTGLLGSPLPIMKRVDRNGAVVVGTPTSSRLIASLGMQREL